MQQVEAHNARVRASNKRTPVELVNEPVDRESKLHDQIIVWCNSQCPCRVKYIHGRMDKRSTTDVGVPDFVLLLNGGRTAFIECKRAGSKPSIAQRNWAHEAARCGHTVHIVHNMAEFMETIK